jgi:hypothetical protein
MLPAVLAIAALDAKAQEFDLNWIDWERLDAGEVLYETTNEERGTVTISVAVAIDADRQAIWDILTACEVSPDYVPNVRACRLIATVAGGSAELFEQVVKPAFFLPKFEHVFRLDYFPPDRIDVSHVSGPMDRLDGGWRLLERPSGAIALVHTMTLKPGFPVPRFFLRNALESDLPDVLGAIRERAEAATVR